MGDPQLPQGLDEGEGFDSEDDDTHQVRATLVAPVTSGFATLWPEAQPAVYAVDTGPGG